MRYKASAGSAHLWGRQEIYKEGVVNKKLSSLVTHFDGKLGGRRRGGDLCTVGNREDVSAIGQNGKVTRRA